MLLNLSLSGIGLAGSDARGFSVSPSKELYLRWLALGALSPFFRIHSSNYSKGREPWMFDDVTLEAAKKIIKFRRNIIPCIFPLAYEYSKEGIHLMRPRFWYEPDDFDETSFYLGKSLLAFRILKPTTSKIKIKLPKGEWFDLSKEEIVSGIIERDANYDYIPVFQKHGRIVPMNLENLIFNFLPRENCSFEYYDENEENPDEWIKINFICEKDGNEIKISWKYEGSYLEKYKTLKFRVCTTHLISVYQEDIGKGFLNLEIEIWCKNYSCRNSFFIITWINLV